ncbi:hypothetical protein E1193_03815 [Micromonospora sp. KC606]|uniref:condensation domain-containing protein n=1 Tax=Micromonospora sp. KC606 TaxID=2530379 RepID=UPI00104FAC79|nr:condensation domain-containing protein [Micromonospora sp. KC606]TDC85044.1 hypothetical protein E1193_03815 [Micromonospora sp. KC606]
MRTVAVEYRGARGGTGPSTWAQREHWATLLANRPHDARFNIGLLQPVPATASLNAVLMAVRRLVERHETLRTTFEDGADGAPTQMVHAGGELAVAVVEAPGPAEPDARRLVAELAAARFEPTTELPVRFAVVVHAGRPAWLGTVISHLAADAAAVDLLERDLGDLLADPDAPGPAQGRASRPSWQPLDQSAYEQSEAGQAVLRRSLTAWRDGLTKAPALVTEPTASDEEPRYPATILRAAGLGEAASGLAATLGVGVSAVFIGATAAALSAAAVTTECSLVVTCANRMTQRTARYVGTIAQQGLLRVDTASPSLYAVVRNTWAGLLRIYESSRYDPVALRAVRRELTGRSNGDHYVNFVEERTPLRPRDAFAALTPGCYEVTAGTPVPSTFLDFGLTLLTDSVDASVRMFADRRRIPPARVEVLLSGVRELLDRAAHGDVAWR